MTYVDVPQLHHSHDDWWEYERRIICIPRPGWIVVNENRNGPLGKAKTTPWRLQNRYSSGKFLFNLFVWPLQLSITNISNFNTKT